jgi:hypothetical protein
MIEVLIVAFIIVCVVLMLRQKRVCETQALIWTLYEGGATCEFVDLCFKCQCQ